jgi:hypothetical protein
MSAGAVMSQVKNCCSSSSSSSSSESAHVVQYTSMHMHIYMVYEQW